MTRARNALAAEWVKIFSTRSWWALAVVMVLYISMTSGGVAAAFALDPQAQGLPSADQLGPGGLANMVYGVGLSIGYLFPVLLGALSVTSEYRHNTLGLSFIWNGSRGAVLFGKVTSQLLMGWLYGVLAVVAAFGPAALILSSFDLGTGLDAAGTWWMFLKMVLSMGVWATLGVGLGVLIRNQAGAIVVVIVFTQFLEPVLRAVGALLPTWGSAVKFMPGAAADAFTGADFYGALSEAGTHALSWWTGGLTLVAYATASLLLGYFFRWRGDVD